MSDERWPNSAARMKAATDPVAAAERIIDLQAEVEALTQLAKKNERRALDAEAEVERLRALNERGERERQALRRAMDCPPWAEVEALRAERDGLRAGAAKAHRLLTNVADVHRPQENTRWARDARNVLADALSAVRAETEGE